MRVVRAVCFFIAIHKKQKCSSCFNIQLSQVKYIVFGKKVKQVLVSKIGKLFGLLIEKHTKLQTLHCIILIHCTNFQAVAHLTCERLYYATSTS